MAHFSEFINFQFYYTVLYKKVNQYYTPLHGNTHLHTFSIAHIGSLVFAIHAKPMTVSFLNTNQKQKGLLLFHILMWSARIIKDRICRAGAILLHHLL